MQVDVNDYVVSCARMMHSGFAVSGFGMIVLYPWQMYLYNIQKLESHRKLKVDSEAHSSIVAITRRRLAGQTICAIPNTMGAVLHPRRGCSESFRHRLCAAYHRAFDEMRA